MLSKIQAGDIEMAYELNGPSDAPVVCLNHCFSTDHRFWDLTMPVLGDYRVLRYDSRGHGQTDKPQGDYTLSMMANDVIALLDVLNIKQVHFAGVSMGGMIGQTLTLEHPQRVLSLTLGNVPSEYTNEQNQAWQDRAETVVNEGMQAIHAELMHRWFTDEAAAQKTMPYQYVAEVSASFQPSCFASATAAMRGLNTTSRLSTITQPVLIFASPDDPGVPVAMSEMMATHIPNASLHWLAPSRHLATLEHPQKFNQLFVEFLQRAVSVQVGIADQ